MAFAVAVDFQGGIAASSARGSSNAGGAAKLAPLGDGLDCGGFDAEGDGPEPGPSFAIASSIDVSFAAWTSFKSPISKCNRGCSEYCKSLNTSRVTCKYRVRSISLNWAATAAMFFFSFGEAAISRVPSPEIFATSRLRICRANSRQKCCKLAPLRSNSSTISSIRAESLASNAVVTWFIASCENMPSRARTSGACSVDPQQAIAWSSAESESRTLPSPTWASTAKASGSAVMPSCAQIHSMRRSNSSKSTLRKENCWQREAIVVGILWDSVVHRMNTTHSGGSSSVFSKALKASLVIWWASSTIKTL